MKLLERTIEDLDKDLLVLEIIATATGVPRIHCKVVEAGESSVSIFTPEEWWKVLEAGLEIAQEADKYQGEKRHED